MTKKSILIKTEIKFTPVNNPKIKVLLIKVVIIMESGSQEFSLVLVLIF